MEYNIKSFLDKFKNIILDKETTIQHILDTIEKETKISLVKNNILLKGSVIYINASPIIKNEILIKKDKIIFFLNQKTLKNKYSDIK